jgi:hypothetical protein
MSYLLSGTHYDPVVLAVIEVIATCFIVFSGGLRTPVRAGVSQSQGA